MATTNLLDSTEGMYYTDAPLMERVLVPYKHNCKYLKLADVIREDDPQEQDKVTGVCEFVIDESCYIDDTGHFNSVEFNICYNQMMYYVIAKSVKEGLMRSFGNWALSDFWKKQLPDILIVDFKSSFRKSINARKFYGEIMFTNIRMRKGLMYINTECRYWDDNNGICSGEVVLAIVNPVI
ncbi:MAG: FcoT family thioesterase [Candidatus Thiodiazotropha endolucinida]|uniref:(2E)-enoyl-[ACP] glycyltransferase n=1 Tax=Candidatus Thiodiazotropha taylori TaxID=2792791 RepID=A0A9E4NJD5_9GAMM|nr:FcoT family thioesterase [Candidatus Thiodiazotropha taylori]MBT3040608.1 FcoT family thioesterase [Candidatus Thiodiazotropha sp. (ex Codakia orbicularis)]MCG7862532.1 FcoT family thioesterase [Candidatus Thiodiazotropha endolucinida]MBV2124238.1 FcoT family thioesterase [Candidatus Thiodiazotropha taylori]MCG7978348.1 FcoT family thioesterase [Candidatus Thiodiazotropha taylori]